MFFAKIISIFSLLSVLCQFVFGYKLIIKPCSIHDDECQKKMYKRILRSISNSGLPEYGIPPIDPFVVKDVNVTILDSIKIGMPDGIAKGIKTCIYNEISMDMDRRIFKMDITCDITIKGKYKVTADSPTLQALLGNNKIEAQGFAKIGLDKVRIASENNFYLRKGDDGEIYLDYKREEIRYTYDVEKAHFNIDNLLVNGDDYTDYIKQCSRSDPKLNECALSSARESLKRFSAGDASRGLEPLDPLFVEEMTVFVPNENGIKLVFLNNYFHGLSDLVMDNLRFDLNKKLIIADCLVTLDVKNKYELSGKILMLPIKSSGDSSINLKNTKLHIRFWYEHVEGDDGKIHWNINKHDIKYEVEKATFRLENLLNDKNIGDQVNKLLNEFWREIVADVGPSICNSLSAAVVKNLGILLAQVSFDELMPE